MSYKKASVILPKEILELLQEYVEGEYIYIPKKEENRKSWGTNTDTRNELKVRDINIFMEHLQGLDIESLAHKYYLSTKSIQRIVLKENRKNRE